MSTAAPMDTAAFSVAPADSAALSGGMGGTVAAANVLASPNAPTGRAKEEEPPARMGLRSLGNGIWDAPGARLIDRAGRRMLPIGDDGFERAASGSVLVDKTMLVADVLDSGYTAALFCRPRRFGKTLNMTMLRAFFEDAPDGRSRAPLFEGTRVWEADGGRYRQHQGAYPVVHVSFNTVKKLTWEATYGEIRNLVAAEYDRHACLADSPMLSASERAYFDAVRSRTASDADYAGSLAALCRMLRAHYGRGVVLLIDEYDAPVMAGYTNGYYRQIVDFLKGWLTGALKDGGEALAFACLTGVQRISKESIFSDLNNLTVSTALNTDFDERFGFTDAEVTALATYLGHPDCMPEARHWYDGYRFGSVDVYNPWSLLNYFKQGCAPDVYWGNTSGNAVLGDLVRGADDDTLAALYRLLEPGGTVLAPLDLGVVFPDVGVRSDALWGMLYLAGYLTTDLTMLPNNDQIRRPLRIPNREIAHLFRGEIIERFTHIAGSSMRADILHDALRTGDERVLTRELGRIARDSASAFDLTSENSVHMLMLGLCYGMLGYLDPLSNREAGYGRFDIQLRPMEIVPGSIESYTAPADRPLVTIELKFARETSSDEALASLAAEVLGQIADRGYDASPLSDSAFASGRMRWGIAFCGKRLAVAHERV